MEKRTDINIEEFKDKLEAEKTRLEEQLKTVGQKDPKHPIDWVPTSDNSNGKSADPNERADHFEESEDRAAILNQLEAQYDDVLRALEKIEKDEYGFDENTGKPIPKERLEANPSARTNI